MCCQEDRFADENPFGVKRSIQLFDDDLPAAGWPTREKMLTLMEDRRTRVADWLAGLNDADLLAPQRTLRHTGQNRLERAIYCLRHTQHHLAELRAILRSRGATLPDWR